MSNFIIKETNLEEALKIFPKNDEFDRKEAGKVDFCKIRLKNLDNIILASYIENIIVGYLIGHEKDGSFYCWVAGVDPKYRRQGIFTAMMILFEKYAKKQGYKKVTLKTLNNKREMLSYMIKNNWNFIKIYPKDNVRKNEILFEKEI